MRDPPGGDDAGPPGRVGDPRDGDDLTGADHDRPGVTLGPRYFRVHEQILHLLAPPCQMIPRAACPNHCTSA